jgi:hypothetical protein
MESLCITDKDGTQLVFTSEAEARAAIASNTALPAAVRSAIEAALVAAPPPPLNVLACSTNKGTRRAGRS